VIGNDLGKVDGKDVTCLNFGLKNGKLLCTSCKWDTSDCDSGAGWCGDNQIQEPNSNKMLEQCDGTDWGKYLK